VRVDVDVAILRVDVDVASDVASVPPLHLPYLDFT
jgi:hypothetical protein